MNNNYITVTQLTRYIKYKIDNDQNLMKIYLKGEISNFKAHTRGHFYFTIKDENTRINAIMFASSAAKVKVMPQDGMKVLVSGRISVYESTGSYQIYVDTLEEDGVGNLYAARKIGIITAPTGAAIKDILSTLKRRWPLAETILFPSLVQGKEAAVDIVRNIELAKNYDLDVLIVGRGGGSIEDLWCFNEEIVARAIYDLDIPVISAVGHEIDFTISDFVADLRAPTPTGAAEMAVPNINDIVSLLNQLEIRLINSVNNTLKLRKEKLEKIKESFILKNPISMYEVKEEKFDNIYERLIASYKNIINVNKQNLILLENKLSNNVTRTLDNNKHKYLNIINKLEALNPLLTIKRGYTVTRLNGNVISSAKKIKKDDIIELEFQDGKQNAKVI